MVRSSLGRAVLADSGLVGSEEYPYYGISVPDFLALTEWLPHEALKASGKVKQMGEADEVIFVSHQWCSFSHPDPRGQPAAGAPDADPDAHERQDGGPERLRARRRLPVFDAHDGQGVGQAAPEHVPLGRLLLIPQPGAAAGGVHAAQHSDHREGERGPRGPAQGKPSIASPRTSRGRR